MAFVRFAARDPGGANVLAAFLIGCAGKSSFEADIWALPRAAQVFEKHGLPHRVFHEHATPDELERAWDERPVKALVTGTSHQAAFESTLWTIARAHQCPSLAAVDQWSNLGPRFQEGRPEMIGAVDEVQRDKLKALGFPEEQVLVIGHPWLSWLLSQHASSASMPKSPIGRTSINVLFVSEGIAKDVAHGYNSPFGFDELDSFGIIYRAACQASSRHRPVELVIKLHPYEDGGRYHRLLSTMHLPEGLTVECVDGHRDPRSLVLQSDLVIGMSSMLLLEAIVMGKPVLSLQPGLKRENMFIAAQYGYATTVVEATEGIHAVLDLLESEEAREKTVATNRGFLACIPRDSVSPLLSWIKAAVR